MTQNCWETGLRGERNKDLERLKRIGEASVCVKRGEKRELKKAVTLNWVPWEMDSKAEIRLQGFIGECC